MTDYNQVERMALVATGTLSPLVFNLLWAAIVCALVAVALVVLGVRRRRRDARRLGL